MRLVKVFGLAGVAAILATALVGATSASAMTTSLCKANELPCSGGNTYPMEMKISADAKEPQLSSSLGTIKCESVHLIGLLIGLVELANGLIHLLVVIKALIFLGCKLGSSKCTVTAEGLPDEAYLSQIEGTMNGELVTNTTKFHVSECLNCTFGGEIGLEVVGGEMGNIVAENILLKEEGIFCPSGAKWKAKFLVSEPSGAMYVSN